MFESLASAIPWLIVVLILGAIVHYYMAPGGHPYDGMEHTFHDPSLKERVPFPSLFDEASVELSVVVPAFREAERIGVMLDETLEYLQERSKKNPSFTWEIIVVDDGSPDTTTDVVMKYVAKVGTKYLRVCKLTRNRGKGGAVRKGMSVARGKYLLFADADGATKFADIEAVQASMASIEQNGLGVVCGSRAHLQDEAVAKRHFTRNILTYGFHILVYTLGVRGIKDTQCGFKLFTRRAAQLIFPSLHLERWAFDVEALFLAQYFRCPISEVFVHWTEIPGSKLSLVGASLQMARDLVRIRFMYTTGLWSTAQRR